jgi:O-antigen ligase/polysaccharide polymerase Wzy-like membrane protein
VMTQPAPRHAPAHPMIGQRMRTALQPAPAIEPKLDMLGWMIVICILTYVWRIQDLYPIIASIRLPILASLGAIGLYLMDGDRRRTLHTITKHPICRAACIIMALAILSVPTSVHDGLSFRFIRDDLSKNFILMTIVAASIRSFADVRRYALAMMIGGLIFAGFVYLYVPVGISGRLGNLAYYDANDLGMLLACSIPLAVFFVVAERRLLIRAMAVLGLLLYILVIVKSGSRGAFLGLLAVAIYLLLFFRAVRASVRIAAVVAGFAGLMLVASAQYWSMMATLLHPKDDYNWSGGEESGRMETWKRGIGYMLRNPLLGVGAAAFPVAEGQGSVAKQEMGIGFKWSAAHNSFVQIGAELGVLGLIAFIAGLVYAFRTAFTATTKPPPGRRTSNEAILGQALAGAVVGYVVAGFFLSQAYAAYLYSLFGLIIGFAKIVACANMQTGNQASTRQTTDVASQWQLRASGGHLRAMRRREGWGARS